VEDDWQQLNITIRMGIGDVYAMAVVEGHKYSPDLIDDMRVNVLKMLQDGLLEAYSYVDTDVEVEEMVESGQEVTGSDG